MFPSIQKAPKNSRRGATEKKKKKKAAPSNSEGPNNQAMKRFSAKRRVVKSQLSQVIVKHEDTETLKRGP